MTSGGAPETPRTAAGLSTLRTLTLEAMQVGWHNAGFLRAFIDDDEEQVFPDVDARFIEAMSPSVVLALIDGLREARAEALREVLPTVERLASAVHRITEEWPGLLSEADTVNGDPRNMTTVAKEILAALERTHA